MKCQCREAWSVAGRVATHRANARDEGKDGNQGQHDLCEQAKQASVSDSLPLLCERGKILTNQAEAARPISHDGVRLWVCELVLRCACVWCRVCCVYNDGGCKARCECLGLRIWPDASSSGDGMPERCIGKLLDNVQASPSTSIYSTCLSILSSRSTHSHTFTHTTGPKMNRSSD